MTQMDARITEPVARLSALERERAEISAEINALQSVRSEEAAAINAVPSARAGDPINRNSTIEKKIALFRRLFRGRSDVFPSVGRITRRDAAGTHLPVRMSGSVGFAKSQGSNVRHVQIRHSRP
jgi:hypothetical protein